MIVILNEEIYFLSEKKYIQIFELNKPMPKIIKIFDEKRHTKEHQSLCNKVRKYGKLLGNADRILRDD